MVIERFSRSAQQHMERVFVPGSDTEAKLKDLGKRIAEAVAQGRFDDVSKLSDQAKALSRQDSERPRFDLRDSGITKGNSSQRWMTIKGVST